ncbi:hypothetical protein E2C01_084323 [Portunus trituberculatus]|uniref:Uncharacterized protein n=1 Tax=Portunus trituberculatus TaxID=210409 RepID=A0A5B7IXZ1_PORTR|nr:hypothetical protein [Portunus trituberculatus]
MSLVSTRIKSCTRVRILPEKVQYDEEQDEQVRGLCPSWEWSRTTHRMVTPGSRGMRPAGPSSVYRWLSRESRIKSIVIFVAHYDLMLKVSWHHVLSIKMRLLSMFCSVLF